MMPIKKAQQNGFMSFVQQWHQRHAKQLNWSACISPAGAVWEQMSLEERQPYIAAAAHLRTNGKGPRSDTHVVSKVIKQQHDMATKQRTMQRDIEQIVRNSARDAKLETQNYHFVMVNYFTKEQGSNIYTPAELAASEFSLIDGIHRVFHTLVNPGINVYGSQYETQQYAKSTHQLPLPPNALGESNLEKIYNDLLKFLLKIPNDNNLTETDVENIANLPPVFTLQDHMPIVSSALDFLNNGIETKLRIYSIEYLFFILKEATCNAGDLPPPKGIKATTTEFRIDMFEYQSNISCEFHEENDLSKYCAKSCVIRWGFTFAKYMCGDLAIKLRINCHMPDNSQFRITITEPADINKNTNTNQTKTERLDTNAKHQITTNKVSKHEDANRKMEAALREPLDIDVILNRDLWEALDDLEDNLLEEDREDGDELLLKKSDNEESEMFTRRHKDERKTKLEKIVDNDDAPVEKPNNMNSKERGDTDGLNLKNNVAVQEKKCANCIPNRKPNRESLEIKLESVQSQRRSVLRNYIDSHDRSITPVKNEQIKYEARAERVGPRKYSPKRDINLHGVRKHLHNYDNKLHDQKRFYQRNYRESISPRRNNVSEFDEKRNRRNISPQRRMETRPTYIRLRSLSRENGIRWNQNRSFLRDKRGGSRERIRRSVSRNGSFTNQRRIVSPLRIPRNSIERNRDFRQKFNGTSREGNIFTLNGRRKRSRSIEYAHKKRTSPQRKDDDRRKHSTSREKSQDHSRRRCRRSVSKDQKRITQRKNNECRLRDSGIRSSSRERNFTHHERNNSSQQVDRSCDTSGKNCRSSPRHNMNRKPNTQPPYSNRNLHITRSPSIYSHNRKPSTPTPSIKKNLNVSQEYFHASTSETSNNQQYSPTNMNLHEYRQQHPLEYAAVNNQYTPGYEINMPYHHLANSNRPFKFISGSPIYESQNTLHGFNSMKQFEIPYMQRPYQHNTEPIFMQAEPNVRINQPISPAFLGPDDLRYRLGPIRSNHHLNRDDLRFRLTDRSQIEAPINGMVFEPGQLFANVAAQYSSPPTDWGHEKDNDWDN